MYLFLAVLGLRCCMGFSLVASRGHSLVVVWGLPIAMRSFSWLFLQNTGSRAHRLSSCGSWVLLLLLLSRFSRVQLCVTP